ncbi:MAG: hypothetical protein PVG83_02070 [Acidimicrobiia bacterium]
MKVRDGMSVLVVAVLVATIAGTAFAQSLLDETATTSTQGLYRAGIELTVHPRVSDGELIELDIQPMFEGVSQTQAEDAAASSAFTLYSVGIGRYDLGETVSGPSVLGTPGVFVRENSHDYVWAGVERANDIETREIRTAVITTSSFQIGCLNKHREVNVAMARPGLPVFESSDEFVGNPMIGNNVMLSFVVDDCIIQAYYFENVAGEVATYQSRGAIEYWDDGTQAVVAFHGAPPTFEGSATVTAVEAPTPLVNEQAFAYEAMPVEWGDLTSIPLTLGAPQPFSEVALMPPLLPGMFPEMSAGSTTTTQESTSTAQSSQSTTTTQSSETTSGTASPVSAGDDADGGLFLPIVLIGLGVIMALLVGWWLWTWWLRRGPYPKEEPETESDPFGVLQDDGIDTQPRPITLGFGRYALQGDDVERMERLEDIVNTYKGTGDIAGVAEALYEFDQWHQKTFDEPWFTWSNETGPGTLVSAVTSDDFLLCREMSCFEFVHLCAYMASDQLGRPRFDDEGNQLEGLQPQWGIVPWVHDPSTLGGEVERGSIVTGRSYWASNQAGYFHVAIAVGDDEVISLGNGGLSKQQTWGWWGACFSPAVYYYLDIGKYKYSAANPAPQNPK